MRIIAAELLDCVILLKGEIEIISNLNFVVSFCLFKLFIVLCTFSCLRLKQHDLIGGPFLGRIFYCP